MSGSAGTIPELDPAKTMEFMNRFASDDNLRETLYHEPKKMPDGSLYSIIRYQGRFSTKFPLEKYPFDTQLLSVVMEDTVSGPASSRSMCRTANAGDAQPGDHLAGLHGRQAQHAHRRQHLSDQFRRPCGAAARRPIRGLS